MRVKEQSTKAEQHTQATYRMTVDRWVAIVPSSFHRSHLYRPVRKKVVILGGISDAQTPPRSFLSLGL